MNVVLEDKACADGGLQGAFVRPPTFSPDPTVVTHVDMG
jgi:hypothetical protein